MPLKLTPTQLKKLRLDAIAAGIEWDKYPPILRASSICKPRKGSDRPPGILPVSERCWLGWVAEGLVDEPIKFDNGVSAWPLALVVMIALYGLARPAGHGRKLAPKDRSARENQPTQ